MNPKRRSAERRNRAFGLNLVAACSEIVVLKWCSPYFQTSSKTNKGWYNFSVKSCEAAMQEDDGIFRV